LSDDESVGAESRTDYGALDVNLTAKNGSGPSHVADTEPADGDGFAFGAALTSDCLAADHQDNDNNNNSGVIDNTQLRLSADRPRAASPSHELVIHQASKLQANTGISVNIDVPKELEDEDFNASAEGNDKDDDDTRFTKGRELPAISDKDPASDSNISELRVGQPDYTQTPQLSSAAASPQHSDLKNDHLPKQLRRRSATGNVRRKHPRTAAPIQLASTASPVSVALEAAQSRALITAPVQEREIRDIEQEIVDDESTNDSDDGDYADKSAAAGSTIGGPRRSRKRARRAKDTEDNDVEAPFTHSLDASSEEIPIHGYFTLKTIKSKVVYCLTFSQALLPRSGEREHSQDTATDLEESQSTAPVADPNHQWGVRKIIGQKMVGRQRHYRVEWKDTWMPESELGGAQELVDEYMANGGSGTGVRKRPLNRDRLATGQLDARGEEEPKKRRVRPRKQT
jgi:hypothetical protein